MQAMTHPIVDAFINQHTTVDWSEPLINVEIPVPEDFEEAVDLLYSGFNQLVSMVLTLASGIALHANYADIETLMLDLITYIQKQSQSRVDDLSAGVASLFTGWTISPDSHFWCDILDYLHEFLQSLNNINYIISDLFEKLGDSLPSELRKFAYAYAEFFEMRAERRHDFVEMIFEKFHDGDTSHRRNLLKIILIESKLAQIDMTTFIDNYVCVPCLTLNGVISTAIAYLTAKPHDFWRNLMQIFAANYIVQITAMHGDKLWEDLELDTELFVDKVRQIWNKEDDLTADGSAF